MINYNNYQYDDNGNMKEIKTLSVPLSKPSAPPTLIAQRNLFWNEEDQLQAMIDFNNSAYYFYNYTGERTWKVVGPKITQTMSGTTIKYNKFNKSTYYLFPQVSVTNTNYTKHIFAGEERICSKIGNGQTNTIPAPTPPTQAEITAKRNNQMNLMKRVFPNICISSTPSCTPANKANILQANLLQTGFNKITTPTTVYENNQYFYVTDHLGSSAWITNKTGKALQHMQYLPFGELFISQQNSLFDSRYKFSGKELDTETGYSYFGARYLDSKLGIWLSVDPLCDERPWITPYNYCQNNPMNRIDPTGLLDDEWEMNKATGEINRKNENKHYDANGKEVDRLFNSRGESIEVSQGVLSQPQPNKEKFQTYAFPNVNEAESFYYFSAESSNVEWTFADINLYGESIGYVGTDYGEGSTGMPGRYENQYGHNIQRMSHSHPPPGGPPSYNIWGPEGKRVGDLHNSYKSNYNYGLTPYYSDNLLTTVQT